MTDESRLRYRSSDDIGPRLIYATHELPANEEGGLGREDGVEVVLAEDDQVAVGGRTGRDWLRRWRLVRLVAAAPAAARALTPGLPLELSDGQRRCQGLRYTVYTRVIENGRGVFLVQRFLLFESGEEERQG